MNREPPSLERKSVDSFFQCTKKQLHHGHGCSSARKLFSEDKLEFIEEIGNGGCGRVWAGKYLGDVVAVKELYSFNGTEAAASSESQRFEEELAKEAEILEQKRSKHIVNLIHYSPEKNMLVMEHCQKGSLARVMRSKDERHIVLEWKNRLKWAWQTAQGMNIMHNQRPLVLHRDLKPPNILLTEDNNVKIGDVGLSKQPLIDFGVQSSGSMDTHYTVWQPPEVMSERRYSTKSDVYSFGVIMHQLLMIGEPYGFNLRPQELYARVCVHVTDGKGLNVPEDRNFIPGKWHDCLEKYIVLMNKCCAREPEDRPEFDEICERLAGIQEEYKKARMVESLRERISTESLNRAFVFLALGTFSVLSVSELLKHSRPAWSTDTSAFNSTLLPQELICKLFGLFCIFGSALCVAWQHRRGTYKFFKKSVFKPTKSTFKNVLDWFEEWNVRQEDQHLPVRSPFEVGPSFQGPGGLASDIGVASLSIPEPEIWKEIRAAFISELQENADCGLQAIHSFCQEHENKQLEQSEWEDLVRLLSNESQVRSTHAWRRYKDHLASPHFFTQGVLSAQDNMPCWNADYPSPWGLDQVSGLRLEAGMCDLYGNGFYAPKLSKSFSFPFDRRGQRETEQLSESDLFPRSFSLGLPTVRSEASET